MPHIVHPNLDPISFNERPRDDYSLDTWAAQIHWTSKWLASVLSVFLEDGEAPPLCPAHLSQDVPRGYSHSLALGLLEDLVDKPCKER